MPIPRSTGLATRLLLGLLTGMLCRAFPLAAAEGDPPPFTISKETTYLTEPRRENGYIDYIQALNNRYSQGVTPENNAAVAFLHATGPGVVPEEYRQPYYKLLGIDPLPAEGPYIIGILKFADNFIARRPDRAELVRERMLKQHEQSMNGPWTEGQFPEIAQWLKVNEQPLLEVVKGCRRSKYFEPLLSDDMLVAVLLPQTQQTREFARLLITRAMLSIGKGNIDSAWQDVLTCHQLARLVGHGPTLIHRLVGLSISSIADRATHVIANAEGLSSGQAKAMLAALRMLPPVPRVALAMNEAERFTFLDSAGALMSGSGDPLEGLGLDISESSQRALKRLLASSAIEWDVILKMGNQWYDRVVRTTELPTRKQRMSAVNVLNDDLKKIADRVKPEELLKSLSTVRSPRQTISESMGYILVSLFLPSYHAAVDAEDRGAMTQQLTEIALALSAYRADHGSYPDALARLSPAYLPSVAKDMFSDSELHYRSQAGGYLLYSVGVNGVDDGGQGYDDGPDKDDLVVRTSAAHE